MTDCFHGIFIRRLFDLLSIHSRYLERIINPHDTKQFENLLAEHHKAKTADGLLQKQNQN